MEAKVNLDNLKLLRTDLQWRVANFKAGIHTFRENYEWITVLEAIYQYLNEQTEQNEKKLRSVIDEYGFVSYKVFY
jgi:hypothetical protein